MSPDVRGLRERKKERTRKTIRTEAFRLFREQGYVETTVEQIAAAADISPSTFFRYFPSKEELALADDLDPLMIEAFERQPPDVPVLTAIRLAAQEVFDTLPPEDLEFEQQRQLLASSVPELRGAMARDFDRNLDMVATLAAQRSGRDVGDFEVRVFAGAVVGAMFSQLTGPVVTGSIDRMMRVIEFLEAGMPL